VGAEHTPGPTCAWTRHPGGSLEEVFFARNLRAAHSRHGKCSVQDKTAGFQRHVLAKGVVQVNFFITQIGAANSKDGLYSAANPKENFSQYKIWKSDSSTFLPPEVGS